MKLLVVTHSADAFKDAVDELIAEQLSVALVAAGEQAEVVRLPFGLTGDAKRELAAARMIDFSAFADAVICLSEVATLVQHPRKVAWLDPANDRSLIAQFIPLDARLLAECVRRYARTSDGLASIGSRNLVGSLLPVPSDPAGWSRVAQTVSA